MKRYTIKNYKGNLVESLTKFAKSHTGMRIVEAVEDEDELKVKAEVEEAYANENGSIKLFEEFINAFAEDIKKAVADEDASTNEESYRKMRAFFGKFYNTDIKSLGLNPIFFRNSKKVGHDFFSDDWPNDEKKEKTKYIRPRPSDAMIYH